MSSITDFTDNYLDNINPILSGCAHVRLSNSQALYPDRQNEDALPLLVVENDQCIASIAFQGAQLLTFSSLSAKGLPATDLLWLSPTAIFKNGKAIRGGIPLCLPWFGPHASDSAKPQHGFARNRLWSLSDAKAIHSGCTQLTWELNYPSSSLDQKPLLFEGSFTAQLIMTLSDTVDIQLRVNNTGRDSFPLSWALHSYHPVANVASAEVTGLDQCEYLDNTDLEDSESYPTHKRRKLQSGNLVFTGEVDRVYVSVPTTQQLSCEGHQLTVEADNCHSAIVWNPGKELATNMADIGAEHYTGFVCVERGNTADNTLELAPGEEHTASIRIKAKTGK